MGSVAKYRAMGAGMLGVSNAVSNMTNQYLQLWRDENMQRLRQQERAEDRQFQQQMQIDNRNFQNEIREDTQDFQTALLEKKTGLEAEAAEKSHERQKGLLDIQNTNAQALAEMNHENSLILNREKEDAHMGRTVVSKTLEGLSSIDTAATKQLNKLESQVVNGTLMPEQAEQTKQAILVNTQVQRDGFIIENYETLQKSGKKIEPSFVGTERYETYKQQLTDAGAIQQGTTEQEIWRAFNKASNNAQAISQPEAVAGQQTASPEQQSQSVASEPPKPGLLQSARLKQRHGNALTDDEALASIKDKAQASIQHYSLSAGDRQRLEQASDVTEVNQLLAEFKQKYNA